MKTPAVIIKNLVTKFGSQTIHKNLDLTVNKGEIVGLVGGSGSGKTVLLNSILGLIKPFKGNIEVLGVNRFDINAPKILSPKIGVLFQRGALFSSMNVMENIITP